MLKWIYFVKGKILQMNVLVRRAPVTKFSFSSSLQARAYGREVITELGFPTGIGMRVYHCPPLPEKAMKLFFSTSPKTLSVPEIRFGTNSQRQFSTPHCSISANVHSNGFSFPSSSKHTLFVWVTMTWGKGSIYIFQDHWPWGT